MCSFRMQLMLLVSLLTGIVTGPPPWVSFQVARALHLEQHAQPTHPTRLSVTCHQDKLAAIMRVAEPPCVSHIGGERSLRATTVARLQVRGPEVQCQRGGVCSVSAGSRVQAEVYLSSAPPTLGFSLPFCSLSPSSDPHSRSQFPLLVGSCPVAVGVSLPLAPSPSCSKTLPTRSFSFELLPFYNNSIQFLHCRVSLCVRDPLLCHGLKRLGAINIPKCPVLDDPCTRFFDPLSLPRMQLLRTVTQPLIVTIPAPSVSLFQSSTGHRKSSLSPLPTHTERRVQGVGVVAVISIILSAFLIGMMLTAGLWIIQNKTAPAQPATSGGSQGLQPSSP